MKLNRITLSHEMLVALLTSTSHAPDGGPVTKVLPVDAELAQVTADANGRTWSLDFTHESFPEDSQGVQPSPVRFREWRALHAFLLKRRSMPFSWGSNDCALFAADGIQAMTGVDIAGDFRGKYSTAAEAFALIKSITGGSTVADAAAWCAEKAGIAELKYPLKAQRGDLVVFENGGNLISGLVHLNGYQIASVTEKGMAGFPIAQIRRAWHV